MPDSPKEIFRKDYVKLPYTISTIDLLFDIRDNTTTVEAKMTVKAGPEAGPLFLNGEGLELVTIAIDGTELPADAYAVEREGLRIHSAPTHDFELSSTVKLCPETNTELSGLYKSGGNYTTQCEAEGFRRITYSLDRPDVLSVYRVRLEADKASCPVLLSNGNRVEQGDTDEPGRHWAVWEDPHPKPGYLFAVVAGTLSSIHDTFTTASGREVQLGVYSEAACIAQCGHAMESLKKAMAWDEEQYGLECDLDMYNIVAVSDFNMGAMENKGLNIFNTRREGDCSIIYSPYIVTPGERETVLLASIA